MNTAFSIFNPLIPRLSIKPWFNASMKAQSSSMHGSVRCPHASPFQGGNIDKMERYPEPGELRDLLMRSVETAKEWSRLNPQVDSVDRFLRRIRGDLAFIERCMTLELNGPEGEEEAPSGRVRQLDRDRIQGIVNNLRGFEGELLAAHMAPGVVGLNKRFWDNTRTISVEVDVVAQEGSSWIEVKNHEVFGLESVHWMGTSSGVKGLGRQVEELLIASRCERNLRRWMPPRIVIFFPAGADPGVAARLEESGVFVASGPDALLSLPPPPPMPAVTNLDVTTLCALCSEVCHADLGDPRLEAWSRGNIHWQHCWQEEKSERVLRTIEAATSSGRALIACSEAVMQFEKLLLEFGGLQEKARWTELRNRLKVVHPTSPNDGDSTGDERMTQRVMRLDKLTTLQRSVFGLGDATQAVTVTANLGAVRSAERQGVTLEVMSHRAVWLTGL